MIKLLVKKNELQVEETELLVSGACNSDLCRFIFSDAWEGMDRTAVFTAGEVSRSVILGPDNACQIPWEVLEQPMKELRVGIYGTRGDAVVLPTVRAVLGQIQAGTAPAEAALEPAPDVYAQMLQQSNEALRLAQSVREDADSGAFDGADAGLPAGGRTGQVLVKASDEDGDIQWATPAAGEGSDGYYVPSVTQTDAAALSFTFDPTYPGMEPVQEQTILLPAGPQGEQGIPGPAGQNGYTPVKGTDYFTAADKAELVQAVLAALPDGDEVSY